MAGLSEGSLHPDQLDKIARALNDNPHLHTIEWSWVLKRIELATEQAPLFDEMRTSIPNALKAKEKARWALDFARSLVPRHAPVAEALLTKLAAELDISPPISKDIPPPPGLERSDFFDPNNPTEVPFHTALTLGPDTERRLLLNKLQTARSIQTAWPRFKLSQLGARIPTPVGLFRADIWQYPKPDVPRRLVRTLAPHEALHRAEYTLLKFLAQSPAMGDIYLAYSDPLFGPDQHIVDTLKLSTIRATV